jgi:hypothetical protein
MDAELQRKLASQAGKANDGSSWSEQYDYHLGMIDPPLLFEQFRMKYNLLTSYLSRDPEGKESGINTKINELCRQLGY